MTGKNTSPKQWRTVDGAGSRRHRRAAGLYRLLALLTLLTAGIGWPAPTFAQGGVGVRAGVSADPDQFFFGVHVESDPIANRLRFRPNVEVGLGDDVTLIAINPEFAYWLPVKSREWGAYVGGGPALNVYRFDDNRPGRGGQTDVEPGVNVLFGLQHRKGFFTEVKVGAIDSPQFKFTVGFAFD
jgi:hypothetical protein